MDVSQEISNHSQALVRSQQLFLEKQLLALEMEEDFLENQTPVHANTSLNMEPE